MKGIIISGTARCGKSFLAKNIKEQKTLSIYQVDLLLIQSLGYKKPKNILELQKTLNTYSKKKRFVNEKKNQTQILFNNKESNKVLKYIKLSKNRAMPNYIIELIETINFYQKKKKWIAADLNVEMIFDKLKRINKNIFLIVLMRNPIESTTASLYWRTFPNICDDSKKKFFYKLLHWKLTFNVAKNLKKKFPNSVKIIFLNELKETSKNYINFFNERCELKKSFFEKNFFDFDSNKGSFCPDGKWRSLLTDDQIYIVKRMTGERKLKKKFILKIFFLISFFKIIDIISKKNPLLSKNILDFCFFPINMTKKIFFRALNKSI